MAALVVGPVFSGTSRFIKENPTTVQLGIHEASLDCGADLALITNDEGSIPTDLIIAQLVSHVQIDQCTVLVSPIEALRARIKSENCTRATPYPEELAKRISQCDFFRLYEDLFDALERQGVSHDVVYVPDTEQCISFPTDRVFVHHNLKGRYCQLPSLNQVEKIAADPRCWYQQIDLPYRMRTNNREFSHLGSGRRVTFNHVLGSDIAGSAILDIGSAMGGLLFAAERLGAARLMGIEANGPRAEVAREIAALLESSAEFCSGDFLECSLQQMFDHVFGLNVLHHVRDFDGFLRKAARLARKTVVLEFPTLTDAKFLLSRGLTRSDMARADTLPLIGVSSETADQSYVYSRQAIRSIMAEIGGFRRYDEIDSPIQDRVVATFSR